ncbi:MAG TPA: hypothetical protein VHB97_17640 [Polyangia bacterium]|jgi:hypothetical protein|nr:hypothetical protein [Polyangia bacterium]
MKRALLTVVLIPAMFGCGGDPSAVGTAEEAVRSETNHYLPAKSEFAGGGGGGSLLVNHGGPTITLAHVVPIYWGAAWGGGNALSTTLSAFIANYGTTGEYNVITQYSGIKQNNLAGGQSAFVDGNNPSSTNVTDAMIQGEVSSYIAAHGFDASAIYEVFLPNGYYSSDGSSTSCGGPSLKYCAYHGNFNSSGVGNVKYASMPYPSCSGCQSSGFDDAQNFEHFISHETREAVTDADGSAWYDRRGYEADDKCAWSPAPFIDGTTGYAYQYEWSNAAGGCVQKM